MKRLTTVFFIFVTISFFPLIASSTPVSIIDYTFGGTINQLYGNIGVFSFLQLGDPYQVELTYAYDPDLSGTNSGGTAEHYVMLYPNELILTTNDLRLSFDVYHLYVNNGDYSSISCQVLSGGNSTSTLNGQTFNALIEGFTLSLTDSSGNALNSTDLPSYINPLDFGSITSAFELSYGVDEYGVHVNSNDLVLKSIVVEPVPEPATLLLLGSGLLGLVGFRKKLKR